MSSAEACIQLKNLKKHFPIPKFRPWENRQYVKAVDGISLDIYKGETFGLVGESGCGKSTTGLMTVGLLDPSEGNILFNGENLTTKKFKNKEIRKDIQMIFQDPYSSLNPYKKIGWMLEEPLYIQNWGTKKEKHKKVEEMLETVGLDCKMFNRYPHELSGGQRQRIGIARAVMLNPKVVIGDEPVSALDVSVQSQILNLMKNLQSKFNLTYLFISHDLNVVHYMSDRIGVMYLGRLMELATVEYIYDSSLHPYTQALLSAVPKLEKNAGQKRIMLEGDVPNPANPPTGCLFHPRCSYAFEKCKSVSPQLKEVNKGHFVSCHLYE